MYYFFLSEESEAFKNYNRQEWNTLLSTQAKITIDQSCIMDVTYN